MHKLIRWIAPVVIALAPLFMLSPAANAATGPGSQTSNNSVILIRDGKTVACDQGVVQPKSNQTTTTVIVAGQTYTCTVTSDTTWNTAGIIIFVVFMILVFLLLALIVP